MKGVSRACTMRARSTIHANLGRTLLKNVGPRMGPYDFAPSLGFALSCLVRCR
jgi:hypothetical protein